MCLENSRGVSKPKEHYYIFKVAVPYTKGSLLFIPYLNPYAVVGIPQVQFYIDLGLSKLVQGFSYQGEEVLVLYYYYIKALVVYAQLEGAILFFSK